MSTAHVYSSDVAFTPSVKAAQTRKGSRTAYAAVEERGASSAFLGRPWDVCDWAPLWSTQGLRQAVRLFTVRRLGLDRFDYQTPGR